MKHFMCWNPGELLRKPLVVVVIPSIVAGGLLFAFSGLSNDAPDAGSPAATEAGHSEPQRLIASARRFRSIARANFGEAILAYSTDWGMERLHAIDVRVWDVERSQAGWSLFFESAVQVFADSEANSPIVGFYNPYSDNFLISAWQEDDGICKIVDVELLTGDWVRDQSEGFELAPQWLRGAGYRAESLAQSVGESIVAFERVFGTANRSDWRSKLPVLSDLEVLDEINYPMATITLNQHLANVMAFSAGGETGGVSAALREQTIQMLDRIADQGIRPVCADASETVERTRQRLIATPVEWFHALRVVAVLAEDSATEGMVLLSPTEHTGGSLVVVFEKQTHPPSSKRTGQWKLKRLDLVDYQYCYEQTGHRAAVRNANREDVR